MNRKDHKGFLLHKKRTQNIYNNEQIIYKDGVHISYSRYQQENKRYKNRNMVHNYIHNDIIHRI